MILLLADEPDEGVASPVVSILTRSFQRALLSTCLLFAHTFYVSIDLFRHEFQEVLFRQKAVLARKLVPGCGHFRDHGVPRDEVVFREAEVAGSFVGIKVDDGDARAWR